VPGAAVGFVYDANEALNEAGLYDGAQVYERAKAAEWSRTARASTLREASEYGFRNAAGPRGVPGAAVGFVYDANEALNEAGLYDGSQVYERAKAAEWSRTARASTLREASEYGFRNAAGPRGVPGAAVGFVYDANEALNEAGLYDGSQVYERAKAGVAVVTVEAGVRTAVYAVEYRNKGDVPAAVQNVARRRGGQRFGVNEAGLYDGNATLEAGVEWGSAGVVTKRDGGPVEVTYEYEGRDAPVDVPAGKFGLGMWRSDPRDGTWSGQLRVSAPSSGGVDWSSGEERSWSFYSTKGNQVNVYVKFTGDGGTAETHVRTATSGFRVVGARDGQVTDIHFLGLAKMRAVRVEEKVV
jgi:hypothetical protein